MNVEDKLKVLDRMHEQLHKQTNETIKFLKKEIEKIDKNLKRRKK